MHDQVIGVLVVLLVVDQVADVVQQRRRLEDVAAARGQGVRVLQRIEDRRGEGGDLLAVPFVRVALAGEAAHHLHAVGDRRARRGRRRVQVVDHRQQHTVANAAVVHQHPLGAEPPHQPGDRGDTCDHDVGTARVEPGNLAARLERRLPQPVQEAHHLGAADGIVTRVHHLAVALELRHLGQVRERAAAADHHLRGERGLAHLLVDGIVDPAAQGLPVLASERVRLAIPLAQPHRPQRQRGDLLDHAPRRENHLGAASPDVDDGGQAVVQVVVAGHAPERQPGLLFGGHDLDTHPAAPPSLADEVPPVRSLAHRAGGDRAQLADAEALGDGLHPPQRLERLLHRAVADAPAGVEPAAQPRHLAVLVEHPVGSVRLHLGDDQPHRVGADVDRRETRRRRGDGPSGSGGRSACRGGYARLGCRACHAAGSLWGERNGAASRSRQCATGFKDITVV